MDEEEGPQVRVKFVTQNEAIRVTETPFAVPTRLNRKGLSQIVNHLLNTESPRPFDFLIENRFLRSSLAKYLEVNELSEETQLTLEYVEALKPPTPQFENNHPDWVSAVASSPSSEFVFTGSYDGHIRMYNASGECLATCKAHNAPIKSLDLSTSDSKDLVLVSSGKDQTGRVWIVNVLDKSISPSAALSGHLNSVDSIALSSQNQIASGSWDNTVRLWELPSTDVAPPSAKKRKSSKAVETLANVEAEAVLVGHTSNVTGVSFHPKDSTKLYSVSTDRSVKMWDLTTHLAAQTMIGSRAISSVSVHEDGLVLTSHPDHCIRLWDPRASDAGDQFVQRTFQSHKQWVSKVEWKPSSSLFASSSYDGSVKVWDMRSAVPLHTIEAHKDKALDVTWTSSGLASGGSDSQLKLFSV